MTRSVECPHCEGKPFKCTRYRDIKASNTPPDENGKAPRATDSDMATFSPTPLDPGDPSCLVVNIGKEDEVDPNKAKPNTETPKVPIKGHTELV